MDNHLTTARLLEAMRAARSNWEALLAQIGEGRLTEPGVEGDWSLKDIIAHITYYETWATNCLSAIRRGEPLPQSEFKGLEMDERNARIYEHNRGKSVTEVLQESESAFQRSIAVVQGLPDADLYDPEFTRAFAADWTVFDLVEGDDFGHYNEHITSVRAWLDRVGVR